MPSEFLPMEKTRTRTYTQAQKESRRIQTQDVLTHRTHTEQFAFLKPNFRSK